MSALNFDVVVLGGGPAGTSGAAAAAVFGQRVALVEPAPQLGGAGVMTGTLPSKTLRETAVALSGLRARKLFGIDLSIRHKATISDFTHHQQQVSAGESERITDRLQTLGVERFQGTGSFIDAHTIRVARSGAADLQLRGEKILIATGSSSFHPPEFSFEDDRVHDSDELLRITALPKRLAVVGAGVIGSEYACTFAAIGVEVHLIDGRDALLPFLDGEISRALAAAMAAGGVKFRWKERVTKCDTSQPGAVRLTLSSGATLDCDGVLVCSGRSSNTAELNLAAAGITPGKRGVIAVDEHYCTEVGHIYATGDVIGAPALAATSMEQSRVAVCHALGITAKGELTSLLPTGIYTIPEVTMVGATEETLKEQGVDFIVGRARYADNPRGRIIGDDTGFLKLLFRREDMRLLGVHVIGEQATEVVHTGLVAMLAEAGADMFNRACFNYPTLGDLYKYATYDALLQRDPSAAPDERVALQAEVKSHRAAPVPTDARELEERIDADRSSAPVVFIFLLLGCVAAGCDFRRPHRIDQAAFAGLAHRLRVADVQPDPDDSSECARIRVAASSSLRRWEWCSGAVHAFANLQGPTSLVACDDLKKWEV